MRIKSWNGEFGGPRWWARALTFAAALGALLGVIGPFGSFLNDGILIRVLYWAGIAVAGTVIAGVLLPLHMRAGNRLGLPRPFSMAVATLVLALPITGLSWMAGHRIWPQQVAAVGPAEWYGQTLLTCACIIGLWALIELATRPKAPSAEIPAVPASPPRFDPADPVLCLQMEDHYVRVHWPSGSKLELLPLQDAIARFGGAEGLRVHRSWWVAGAAIAGAERDARNWRLRLTNGLAVPIARNRVAEARSLGWIGAD